MIDDLMDEPEYDHGPDKSRLCHECNRETIGESCGFCGNDLCPMCFECGCGFCSATHTQEQIDAYEDDMYPCQTPEEQEQRKRSRAARDDLKRLGVLP